MPWLRLRLELVTPCFVAGSSGSDATADDLRDEGVRPPSLVGQWRYWLRATLGCSQTNWRQREAELFGSQHDGGRQGRVMVRPRSGNLRAWAKGTKLDQVAGDVEYDLFQDGNHTPIDPLFYLLGQGLCHHSQGLQRPALAAGQFAEVEVNLRNAPDSLGMWTDLRRALWCWQAFGGLGSRSRRGWGSIRIAEVVNPDVIPEPERGEWRSAFPTRREDFLRRLQEIAGGGYIEDGMYFSSPTTDPREQGSAAAGAEPGFSHLGACCAILPGVLAGTWPETLAALGNAMLQVRSNVTGRARPSTALRVQDHDQVYAALYESSPMRTAPHRAAFGLPHNYFFAERANRQRRSAQFEGDVGKATRRASPVLLHIGRTPQGYYPVVLWLRSKLTTGSVCRSKSRDRLAAPGWSAVVEFLNACRALQVQQPIVSIPPPGAETRQQPTHKQPYRQVRKGETRQGYLSWLVFRYMAMFPDADPRTQLHIEDPHKLLSADQGAMKYAPAEFFIVEGNKARIEKLL